VLPNWAVLLILIVVTVTVMTTLLAWLGLPNILL